MRAAKFVVKTQILCVVDSNVKKRGFSCFLKGKVLGCYHSL